MSSSKIRLGLVRKSSDALSEGVSASKSNKDSGEGVVVVGGGGKVGHDLDLIVVSSSDFNSTSIESSGSYFFQYAYKKQMD